MYEANIDTRDKIASLFESSDSTIVLSYLQRHMGRAWVDNLENPTVAQIMVGIFVFYAGDANSKAAEEMLFNLPEHILAIVGTDDWKGRIESLHEGSTDKFQRFEFEKNLKNLDKEKLKGFLKRLPEGYELKKIDKSLANEPSLHEVSEDFISQFDSVEDFLDRGIGYCIVCDGKVVCGASSFSIYDNGIEIEVGTHPVHRRKGLASIVTSALILDCIERGIYPNWDAANPESVKLAQKLGYVLKEEYDTYYINNKKAIN